MINKEKAEYVDRATEDFCKDCSMYKKPNRCTLVKGHINPKGNCRYWEAKSKLLVENK